MRHALGSDPAGPRETAVVPWEEPGTNARPEGRTTPVHAEYPDPQRVSWRSYNGEPSGSRLIRMAPWFDDGLLSVQVSGRYYYEDAATAHRRVEEGQTQGKLVLIVDDDLARQWEV